MGYISPGDCAGARRRCQKPEGKTQSAAEGRERNGNVNSWPCAVACTTTAGESNNEASRKKPTTVLL